MKRQIFVLAAICLASIATARSDPLIEAAQRILKEQGFYYGQIDGTKSSETTAAIRRYQIRNGLKINGELNSETQQSLGIGTGRSPKTVPKLPPRSPSDENPATPPPDRSIPSPAQPDFSLRAPGYTPDPRALPPEMSGILGGTPYELAPPGFQRRVIADAQIMLARRGYYRSDIDGIYGPATAFALRTYQARVGLEITGRLDLETLAAMGLLRDARSPRRPHWRFPRSRPRVIPRREWVPQIL